MTFLKPAIALVSAVWLIAANAGIEAPRIGFVRLADRQVWTLRGVAGSFYFGERMANQVDAIAFNGTTGVRTSNSGGVAELLGSRGEVIRTVRIDGEVVAIGLSPLEAVAYVLTETELWHLSANAVNRFLAPELPEGQLAGITGAGSYLELAMVRDGQVAMQRLWLDSGELLTRETFAAQPDLLLVRRNGVLLWAEGDTLVLRRADASLAKVQTGSRIVALHEVGERWYQATGDDGRQFLARIDSNDTDLTVNLLPETAP
jgi:hypothetical protein